MNASLTRRCCLTGMGATVLGLVAKASSAAEAGKLRLSSFQADVTVPPGHGMMGGAWQSKTVADPLAARGIVLLGSDAPLVWISVDWCEIRNDAYTAWQTALAKATGTTPERVLITTVHQHDAPVTDLTAESLLREAKCAGSVCDPLFHDKAVARVAAAASASLEKTQAITHLGIGQAKVEKLASNRRYETDDGQVRYDRTSASRGAAAIAAEEGLIDPWLKTLTFFADEQPVAALSFYAVHPMSYYGGGEVSADFPGLARRRRQKETPNTFQMYCSGASGNVTAGKYNTGARENRAVLAERLYAAMLAAARDTRRVPLDSLAFRSEPVAFKPREGKGFTTEDLEQQMKTDPQPFNQCLAAMGRSWRQRCATGQPIEIGVIDFGPALLLLLPGEAYVEFQLAAQKMRPDKFVCVAGYGDGATGYIPTALQLRENDSNLSDWCWVTPEAEATSLAAMRKVLQA